MGSLLFVWLGRCSSCVFFMVGGLEVVPPLPPPPAPNILVAIFLLVVAMIFVAMGEIIGTLLRGLDVLSNGEGAGPVDPTKVDQYAKSVFGIFGMASTQISNIAKATIEPKDTAGKHD